MAISVTGEAFADADGKQSSGKGVLGMRRQGGSESSGKKADMGWATVLGMVGGGTAFILSVFVFFNGHVNEKQQPLDQGIRKLDARMDRSQQAITQLGQDLAQTGAKLGVLDYRVGILETRLDKMDARLDTIDTRLDQVDVRLGKVESRLETVDIRLAGMDTKLADISETMGKVLDAVSRRR
ncbi:hypothetical protein [Cupriavidus agavae]|nr:hypothetical protein [Cupriavidus agavae]